MAQIVDVSKFKQKKNLKDRYAKQLKRLESANIETGCIKKAVAETAANLASAKTSLVIYGEPQSGKTEMMICLTAKLLDQGHPTIIHLMNDSVDLLTQNLKRFKSSGLAPAPRGLSELVQSSKTNNQQELVAFCKKNRKDLEKLIGRLAGRKRVLVIDDEADYATPNARINKGKRTTINNLVGKLIGDDGYYIGVTATPARLDLNNTFQNETEKWVSFPSHSKYTGQKIFFPLDKKVSYRLTLLKGDDSKQAKEALIRFLVSAAYLNLYENDPAEQNYTMLVHTSGRTEAHEADRTTIEESVQALINTESPEFGNLVKQVYGAAERLYPQKSADNITQYVVDNASRATFVVLNSVRDRKAAGENATEPTSPFTIIIGGNIVSRGVTFPNLLSMFFTRNVKHKLQQDTYIQRARMFGARGKYLKHFELSIPSQLYADWHSCFVFHALALATINNKLGSPVWIANDRISVAAASSIDKATVAFNRREMSFGMFKYSTELDSIISQAPMTTDTLTKLREKLGERALPKFLIDYIENDLKSTNSSLAMHAASSIAGYKNSANLETISRAKGFMGKSQLEIKKFPSAIHHVKIFYNSKGKARLFYKFLGSLQFIQNVGDAG